MPELDGLGVLRQIDNGRVPVVVFVTAYDQYALQAFDVHAVDYLLKPFDDGRFRQAVARAKQQARQGKLGALSQQLRALLDGVSQPNAGGGKHLRRLTIKSGGRVTIVPTRDIDWIEAEGDYVKIHAGKAWHLLRETMKHLESEFDPATFVRIHRSTIVNVERIKELQPYFRGEYVVILHDGTKLKSNWKRLWAGASSSPPAGPPPARHTEGADRSARSQARPPDPMPGSRTGR
jgi:two-component system LytT family response regulator